MCNSDVNVTGKVENFIEVEDPVNFVKAIKAWRISGFSFRYINSKCLSKEFVMRGSGVRVTSAAPAFLRISL